MASYTEKLGLKKPEGTDKFNIGDFNDNMDIIDGIPDMVSSGGGLESGKSAMLLSGFTADTSLIGQMDTAEEVTET